MIRSSKLNVKFKRTIKINQEEVFHNAKLLLSQYRAVKWRLNESVEELDYECIGSIKKNLIDYIENLVENDTRIDRKRIEDRLNCIEESKSIVKLIDHSINLLGKYPDKGELYKEIILSVYIYPSEGSMEAIADIFSMSRSTFFREKKKAVELFGNIMWGYITQETKNIYDLKNEISKISKESI